MKRQNQSDNPKTMQEKFNVFVENYNHDYIFFLQRAASGYYKCLITAGRILKDLHDFVIFMHQATKMKFEVVPYPFTFRHGREYYINLGFDGDEITKIHGFFDYVKELYKKDFEECMKEDKEFLCKN
jgi:hypothetical protein